MVADARVMPTIDGIGDAPPRLNKNHSVAGSLGRSATLGSSKKHRALRQASFRARHGEAGAARYIAQVHAIRQVIAEQERVKRYVLHPNKNRWLSWWDLISTLALLYTAAVTPFEAAFVTAVYGPAAWRDPWFLLNRLLDGIFALDMILQFFIAVWLAPLNLTRANLSLCLAPCSSLAPLTLSPAPHALLPAVSASGPQGRHQVGGGPLCRRKTLPQVVVPARLIHQ